MKIHLPLALSALFGLAVAPTVQASIAPPLPKSIDPSTGVFSDLSFVLDGDESLLNPNWTGDPESAKNTISFDGQGEHSLTLEKNSSGETANFIQIGTDASRLQGTGVVSFENLQSLSLKNTGGESSTGSGITIYHEEGGGSVEFSKIAGDVSIEGFRPKTGKSPVFIVGNEGDSAISFSDIGGNISISDNKETSGMPIGGAALTVWVDPTNNVSPYTPYKASVSFSNVKGDINFSNNASRYAGGAIDAASFNGQAQVSFSQIQGNTTFSGNSAVQGGAINIQGFYDSTQEDVSLTYTDSTGNVTFSNNSASSGGAVSVTGISQTIKFSNLKGDVVFSGNSATNFGGAILLGDYTLGAVSPMTAYKFPDLTRNVYARLEFSNIEGNVSFLNNSVNTKNGGGKGGAIYVADTHGYSPTRVYLSADKGDITFSGNTVDNTANAIHLEGQTFTYLRAQEGHSVNFYDPITTNTGTLASYEKYNIYINSASNGTTYDGRVVFSGAHINAETLGGDAATMEARLAASKTSKINGNIFVYDGTLEITDGAVVHCNSARLLAGSTLEISRGGELKLSLNGAANQGLVVDAGAILMTGDTTLAASGDGTLKTTTGVSGGILQVADGAILGTFVHDTGKTTKEAIVSSMKNGFQTSDHVDTKYLYQIGKNVELEGTECVEKNEILNATDGGSLTISTIGADGMAIADQGGSISVKSIDTDGALLVSGGTVEITEQSHSTFGSFSQSGNETTSAQIRVDSTPSAQSLVNAASTDLKAVENEVTTINSNTTVNAKSIDVSSSQLGNQTTLVNDGTINSVVNVSGDGSTVKGSGTFCGGLSVTSGGTLIVGNSPGLQIYTGPVELAGNKVIFSVDGLQQASQTTNGWGSGTYSNIQMDAGTFRWDVGTTLGLELSSSLSTLSPGTSIELVLMTFKVGSDSANSVAEITLGGQTIWNGNLYTELTENPINIEILNSLEQGGDGPELVQNLENTKLVTSYDEETGIIKVSLQGEASVPEPSTSMMGLLGVTLLLLRRKK